LANSDFGMTKRFVFKDRLEKNKLKPASSTVHNNVLCGLLGCGQTVLATLLGHQVVYQFLMLAYAVLGIADVYSNGGYLFFLKDIWRKKHLNWRRYLEML
jgi:uncharacterized membrane protein YuzA (DUF378 family)